MSQEPHPADPGRLQFSGKSGQYRAHPRVAQDQEESGKRDEKASRGRATALGMHSGGDRNPLGGKKNGEPAQALVQPKPAR
jgi:hypothetical protein